MVRVNLKSHTTSQSVEVSDSQLNLAVPDSTRSLIYQQTNLQHGLVFWQTSKLHLEVLSNINLSLHFE